MTEHKKLSVITTIFKVLLIIGLFAAIIFGYMQLKGLKNRMTTAENRLNDGGISANDWNDEKGQTLSYTILSQKNGQAEVESYDASTVDQNTSGISYQKKNVLIFEVSVSNPSENSFELDPYNLRAKTDKGRLISPSNTKEQFQNSSLGMTGLAPGGTTKLTLYFVPVEGETIVSLYDNITNKNIE